MISKSDICTITGNSALTLIGIYGLLIDALIVHKVTLLSISGIGFIIIGIYLTLTYKS